MKATAVIAEDEPILREALVQQLGQAWPDLHVVAQARNGREAIALFESTKPDVCFLDLHMPGVSGITVAQHIGQRAHVVFVTAFDQYAVQAFAQGVQDYLMKPVTPERLRETVSRLQLRLRQAQPASSTELLLQHLAQTLARPKPAPLKWIHASVGQSLRLIATADIDYLRADAKYTLVAWRGENGAPQEALIRTPLKDLVGQLDAEEFLQVHRSVLVNLRAISHIMRGEHETADIFLKSRKESLPVSRSYLHLFRQM
jgi:DNA-binding LytR/AlgR family response regulator